MLPNMPFLDGAAILEALPEGAILIDQDARIRLINAAAVSILGIDASAAVGRSIADLPGGFVLDGTDEKSEYLDLPDRWVRCRRAPLAVGAEPDVWTGTLLLLDEVGLDILAHPPSADFVSALIHELRAPLTTITGYTNLLLLGTMGPLPEMQREAIDVIKDNVRRVMEEINNVVTAYRTRSGQLQLDREALDIVVIVREVAQRYADSYARQDLKLTIDCEAPEVIVDGDQRALRDILATLLEQACRYSQPKTEVTVTIANDHDEARVTIQDTGFGFTTEGRPAYRHTYMHVPWIATQGLVKLQGGRLWAESVQDQGCRVSFTLPYAEP
jgi:signal transduction histidine kinase